jgi:CRISPR/Cas system CSM-associated protein Csm2 small subunit
MAENAFEILEREHTSISELFDQIRDPNADRHKALTEAIAHIATHVAVERSYLYPLVNRKQIGSRRLGRELLSDYKRMQKLLAYADRRKWNSPDLPDLMDELIDVFEDHRIRCVNVLMPALQKELEVADMETLGAKMAAAESIILSHPHPYLLLLGGPIYQWTTRVASRWDRMRDRTVRNR